MTEKNDSNLTKANVVAKAGIWFTVCNFAFRGMAFFTVPIFTRLMTKADIGDFGNYSSWVTILMVITSFDLSQSIIRSKVEHEDDIDCYIWSILSFSTGFTILLYILAIINESFVINFLQVQDVRYVHLMFLYFLTSPAYSMLITKHRAFYKYKIFVLITGIVTVTSTLLSVALVALFEDKLWGRTLGQYLPSILAGAGIFVYLIKKGRQIKLAYWKYALMICVPLVPHSLSVSLLASSGKIILKQLSGAEIAGLYSVACSCYHIVTILMNSMNQAWTPWLFENLKNENYHKTKSVSKVFIIIFAVCAWGAMLLGPELIVFFGGDAYKDAVQCLIPLMTSCIIQFIYLFYVNTEFYTKKTTAVAVATICAAGVNIALNYIFVPMFPEYGHVVISYATLAGCLLLMVFHYLVVRKRNLAQAFDTRFFAMLVILSLVLMVVIGALYSLSIIRFVVFVVYAAGLLCIAIKNRRFIISFLRKE